MKGERGRVLAVDPGEKRIGLAISDPTGTIANPLQVLKHVSRLIDAASIVQIAEEWGVVEIVIGQALELDGTPGVMGRKAQRLAEAIRSQTEIPVVLWDESGSTQTARQARQKMGIKRSQRRGHMDDLAAVVILQSYLNNRDSVFPTEEL
ncbi:MAG: putative pre-16S rRNA nuclease [Bellilinea sp.]|nr:MAG: putative pre-16S rRNA nuclease [Bellilinea sp.]